MPCVLTYGGLIVSAAIERLHRRLKVEESRLCRRIRIARSKSADDCTVAPIRFAKQAGLTEGHANVHNGGVLQ
jgi:hypothetical protein